jgi:hypothetical protein
VKSFGWRLVVQGSSWTLIQSPRAERRFVAQHLRGPCRERWLPLSRVGGVNRDCARGSQGPETSAVLGNTNRLNVPYCSAAFISRNGVPAWGLGNQMLAGETTPSNSRNTLWLAASENDRETKQPVGGKHERHSIRASRSGQASAQRTRQRPNRFHTSLDLVCPRVTVVQADTIPIPATPRKNRAGRNADALL